MKKVAGKQEKLIPFHKLHGAGNDILVVFSKDLPKSNLPNLMRQMAHRQMGIGCDQIVEVKSLDPLAIQIWNGDGTKAEMCANGTRVFLYLAQQKKWMKPSQRALKVSGKSYSFFPTSDSFELSLGEPKVWPDQTLSLEGEAIPYTDVNVGNPHIVIFASDWKKADFSHLSYGPKLETHSRFPAKTNVHFVDGIEGSQKAPLVHVRHWERGAGPTLSCGSGAVAVAAALRQKTGVSKVTVEMNGFLLKVRFEGEHAFLSGPSTLIASGLLVRPR